MAFDWYRAGEPQTVLKPNKSGMMRRQSPMLMGRIGFPSLTWCRTLNKMVPSDCVSEEHGSETISERAAAMALPRATCQIPQHPDHGK